MILWWRRSVSACLFLEGSGLGSGSAPGLSPQAALFFLVRADAARGEHVPWGEREACESQSDERLCWR